jgi:hypothetical protein
VNYHAECHWLSVSPMPTQPKKFNAILREALMLTGSACMDVLGPLGGMVNVVYCGVMGIVFQSLKS